MRRSKPVRAIAACCFFCINPLLARLVARPVVLCFHRIKESSGSLIDQRAGVTSPDSFERILRYMGTLGYRFVSLEHLVRSLSSEKPGRVAVVTFDDGFKDLRQNAYPILARRGIPFTLFLITGTVDSKRLLWIHRLYAAIDGLSPAQVEGILARRGISRGAEEDLARYVSRAAHAMDRRGLEELAEETANAAGLSAEKERRLADELYLTKADLLEMKRGGLSIEAHGHEHVPLALASEAETRQEIVDSVEYIRSEFRDAPRFYALSYGSGNRFVRDIAKTLGLLGMATTEPRLIRANEDAFDLPRICVSGDISALYLDLGRAYLEAIGSARRSTPCMGEPAMP